MPPACRDARKRHLSKQLVYCEQGVLSAKFPSGLSRTPFVGAAAIDVAGGRMSSVSL